MIITHKTLVKLTSVGFFISFYLLIISHQFLGPPIVPLKNISQEHLNKGISTVATINSISTPGNITLVTLEYEGVEIKGIIFEHINFSYESNKEYSIKGKVLEYKNELEIKIHEITPENQ